MDGARTAYPSFGSELAQADPPPRRTRVDGQRSRKTILAAATDLATVEGLEGLSIGRLAAHIGMSKSGLYAHFRSKQELQLATIARANEVFEAEVIHGARQEMDALARLSALCENFLSHVERRVFPGGCFFASVAAEFDTHAGPVRDRITQVSLEWIELLERAVTEAQDEGFLKPDLEPAQLAFEMNAVLHLANSMFVLLDSAGVIERARRCIASQLAAARI